MDMIWVIAGGCVAGYFAALPVLLSFEVAYNITKANPRYTRLDLVAGAGVVSGGLYVWLRHPADRLEDFGSSHLFEFVLAGVFVATLAWRGITMGRQHAAPPEPTDVDVVAAYSRCLENHPVGFKPEALLPYPRERIQAAVQALQPLAKSDEDHNALRVCLEALEDYVPPGEIPPDPEQAAAAWLKTRAAAFAASVPSREAVRLRLISGGRR